MQKAMEQISASGFQSPRRWGGVGLDSLQALSDAMLTKFQSPRRWGGVGLSAYVEAEASSRAHLVSIPSEVGRGRARADVESPGGRAVKCRFNPLGGGAGSGSQYRCEAHRPSSRSRFQSPRRWGGVGLSIGLADA